jgi:amidophosphoribosyltransferase
MEHHCGIFSVVDDDVGDTVVNGLRLIQHRGYESAGISFLDKGVIRTVKDIGTVDDVFRNIKLPKINKALGHVRYSTVKKSTRENAVKESQPFQSDSANFSLVHNGNIPTKDQIQIEYGISIESNSDTLTIVKLIEMIYKSYNDWPKTLMYIMNRVAGSYCFAILTGEKVYAMRDRYGIRPLVVGRSKKGFCVTSETVGLQQYAYVRDVKPGEIISIDMYNFETVYQYHLPNLSFCSFEIIYFMHHDSLVNGNRCDDVRYNLGYSLGLAEEWVVDDSVVVCLPNSSIPNARGFSDAIKRPYCHYIRKRDGVTRTFILPTEEQRREACDNKFIFDDEKLKETNVYVVDDSIVRGTTMLSIVGKLRKIGVKSIHLRITSPVITDPCYFGIDMSTKSELVSYGRSVDEIKNYLGADSLRYLDIDTMKKVLGVPVCTSCFTGEYNRELLDW